MKTIEDAAEPWRQHLRIAILRACLDTPFQGNHESLIVDMLNAVLVGADRDQVRDELVWLNDQGLVVAEVKSGSLVATLTETGQRVGEGQRVWPGVKRPNVTAGVARRALSISLDQLKR